MLIELNPATLPAVAESHDSLGALTHLFIWRRTAGSASIVLGKGVIRQWALVNRVRKRRQWALVNGKGIGDGVIGVGE